MASRWRVWDNEAHINISGRNNGVMTLPVKHSVGRGNLHLLTERVSLPQLDAVKRSPGSRSKPPPRGLGRADILRNRLSRQNEAKKPGVKTSYATSSIDKSESSSNSKSTGDIVIKNLPPTVTQKEVCALLDPYDSSIVSSTLVKEEDKTITALVRMDNVSAAEWIISSLHGAEIYGSNYTIECSNA